MEMLKWQFKKIPAQELSAIDLAIEEIRAGHTKRVDINKRTKVYLVPTGRPTIRIDIQATEKEEDVYAENKPRQDVHRDSEDSCPPWDL
jgi:hypothetical protein